MRITTESHRAALHVTAVSPSRIAITQCIRDGTTRRIRLSFAEARAVADALIDEAERTEVTE